MSKAVFARYLAAAFLVALAVVVGVLHHEPGSLVFLKAIVLPMFLLANAGLRSFFPAQFDQVRGMGAWLEYHVLNALLLAAMVALLNFEPERSLSDMVLGTCIGVGLLTSINVGLLLWKKRKLTK